MVLLCHLLYDTIEMHGVPVFEIRMEPKPNSFQLHYIGIDLLQKHNYKHMDTVLIRNLYLFIYLFISKFIYYNADSCTTMCKVGEHRLQTADSGDISGDCR